MCFFATHHCRRFCQWSVTIPVIVIILLFSALVFAHGGKKHAQGDFTALQALQKAAMLYDRLIVSGKLDESWETGLQEVSVSVRQESDGQKSVVRFTRPAGDPRTLFLFFNAEGEYAGANYTGQ